MAVTVFPVPAVAFKVEPGALAKAATVGDPTVNRPAQLVPVSSIVPALVKPFASVTSAKPLLPFSWNSAPLGFVTAALKVLTPGAAVPIL